MVGAAARPSFAASEALPEDLKLIVTGGGWGHGHGMSQYGARAQAEAGRSWGTILHSYYSNVSIVDRGSESLRVLVESGTSIAFGGPESYTAKWAGGATLASSSGSYPFMRVRATSAGVAVDRAAAPGGPWSQIATGTKNVYFYPTSGAIMPVISGSQLRYYRGYVEAYRRSSTTMYAVNHLTMDRYLYGVVPREMPASWHSVGLRAQAVAARTYSSWKKANASSTASYDICATTQCQMYRGYGYRTSPSASMTVIESSRTNDAVDATTGIVMVSGGEPIFAEFHSSSGGYTAQGSRSYLAPVADPWDATYSPHHRWTATMTVSQIEARWPAIGRLVSISNIQRDGSGPWGGRVVDMTLNGTSGSQTISGGAFNAAFSWPTYSSGTRSRLFTIAVDDADLVSAPTEVVLSGAAPQTVRVRMRNTGNRSWPVGSTVALGTYGPADRTSPFADDTWTSATRPAYVTRDVTGGSSSVSPGEVAEFAFVLDSIGIASGSYLEKFRPVAGDLTWFGESFAFKVRVATDGAAQLGANLARNASFESVASSGPAGWAGSGTSSSDGVVGGGADGTSQLRVAGASGATKTFTQTVSGAGDGERLVFSVWNRASYTDASGGTIDARAILRNADGTTSTTSLWFPRGHHAWTYREAAIAPAKPYKSVTLTLNVRDQAGTVWFDRVRLARDELTNPGFDSTLSNGWTLGNAVSGDGRDAVVARAGTASLRLGGRGGIGVYARQNVAALSGAAGARIRLGGWNRTDGTDAAGGAVELLGRINNTDGTTQLFSVGFPGKEHDWRYGEAIVTAEKVFSSVSVYAKISDQTGTAWFDEITLNRGEPAPSLSANAGFELGEPAPGEWTLINTRAADATASSAAAGVVSLHLHGIADQAVYARQLLPIAGDAGDSYVLSAYNKASGIDAATGQIYSWARINYADGTTEAQRIDFPLAAHDWQHKSVTFTTTKPYLRIDVFAVLSHQTGDAWFDNVSLTPA